MRIEKCEINRYGKLKSYSADFGAGINLIKGPNEAGKSTLVDALTDALFENPKTTRKEIKARTSWGSEQDFEINLEFESEGLTYTLSKDFESGDISLLKHSSGETIEDRKRVDSLVAGSLGLSNKEVFLATACIRQDEMARISDSPEAIKDRLEALITGGKEEVLASRAINKINASIKALTKDGPKNKGEIPKLQITRDELKYELDKAKREIDSTSGNRAKLREIRSNLARVVEELKVKSLQSENSRRALLVEDRVAELEDRFGDLKSRINIVERSEQIVKKLREEIAELPIIDKSDLKIAEDQSVKIEYLETKKTSTESEVRELTERIDLSSPSFAIKLMTILSLVSSGAAFYWYKFTGTADVNFLIGSGAAIALFSICAFIWWKRNRNCVEIKTQHTLKKARLDEMLEDIKAAQISIDTVLDKYDFEDVESLRRSFERRSELEKEIKNELHRYDEHLSDKSLKEIEDELREVTRDLAVESEKCRELKIYSMKPDELAELENSVKALESGKKKLESDLITIERHLDYDESGIEHQASIEERIEEIDSLLARKNRRLQVLEKTRDFIEKARKDVLKSTLQQLDDETSQILGEVTSGRYSKVRFDRQSLRFEVYSSEREDWVDPQGNLSRGTVDQLFLAALLALVRIISEEKHPVIILDDPFVTFDEQRRNNALDVLKRLGDRYQIFLLTCHDHYDGLTENVIQLA